MKTTEEQMERSMANGARISADEAVKMVLRWTDKYAPACLSDEAVMARQEIFDTIHALEKQTAVRLLDIWAASHGKPVPWGIAVNIVATIEHMPEEERTRLLALGE